MPQSLSCLIASGALSAAVKSLFRRETMAGGVLGADYKPYQLIAR